MSDEQPKKKRGPSTPEWMQRMTAPEYKAWVERGEFPARLVPVVPKDKQDAARARVVKADAATEIPTETEQENG